MAIIIYTKVSSWPGIKNTLRNRKNKYVRGRVTNIGKRFMTVEWEYDGHALNSCVCQHIKSPFDEGAKQKLKKGDKLLK
jgi:hypothetical protein